jgi:hypothetical protein
MNSPNPHAQIAATCFFGGALGFALLITFVPTMGFWGKVIGVLSSAAFAYVMCAPLSFARGVWQVVREVAMSFVALFKVMMTPRPILLISVLLTSVQGAAIWIGFVAFGDYSTSNKISGLVMILLGFNYGLLGLMWMVEFSVSTMSGVVHKEADSLWLKRWKGFFREDLEARFENGGLLVEDRMYSLLLLPITWNLAARYCFDLYVRVPSAYAKMVVPIAFGVAIDILLIPWRIFRIVHTELRLICMVDAPLGAMIMYGSLSMRYGDPAVHFTTAELAGLTVGAAALALALGLVNYAVVGKRWLKTIGVPEPVAASD